MDTRHPHDIIDFLPKADQKPPPGYIPLTDEEAVALRKMTVEERAAWLALVPQKRLEDVERDLRSRVEGRHGRF